MLKDKDMGRIGSKNDGIINLGVLDMETNNTGGCRYETYQCTFRVL